MKDETDGSRGDVDEISNTGRNRFCDCSAFKRTYEKKEREIRLRDSTDNKVNGYYDWSFLSFYPKSKHS